MYITSIHLRSTASFWPPALLATVTKRHDLLADPEKGRALGCDAATIDRRDVDSFPPRSISTHRQASAGACISPKSPPKFALLRRPPVRDDCGRAREREPIEEMNPPSAARALGTVTYHLSDCAVHPVCANQHCWYSMTARTSFTPGDAENLGTKARRGNLARHSSRVGTARRTCSPGLLCT